MPSEMTFPITKRDIRELLKGAQLTGEKCLSEFLEANKKGRGGYCINWAAINLYDVQLMFDEDADMTLSFRFDEGQCDKFDAFMRERIMECIPGDFSVEVISEW